MNAEVTTLKVLVAVVLLAGAPLALKRRWRLFLALPLAAFQGFLPWVRVSGVPIPLAFLGGLMLWPELIREFRTVIAWKPTAYVLGIVILYTVSMLWSPDRKLGFQPIGYFLQFLVIFSAVVTEGRRDETVIRRLLLATLAVGLVQAFAIVIFRLLPGLKLEFYLSSLSQFFINHKGVTNMFLNGTSNVLNPTKSAGMLGTNANVSATFLGVLAFIALGLALHLRKQWLGVIALGFLGAVPFVGSKAGLIIAAGTSVLALHVISVRYRTWRNRLRMMMVAIVLLGTVSWLAPQALEGHEGGAYHALGVLFSRSDQTLATREKIWAYAPQVFIQHPFRGQGFGGWQKGYNHYARRVGIGLNDPPHNTVIYLWSQGGLLAALLGLAFIYQVLKLGWRQMRDRNSTGFGLSLAMTFAFLWTFVQGMGENFGLLGDVHISPILAGLLALSYLQRRSLGAPAKDPSCAIQIAYPAPAMPILTAGTGR